MGESAVLVYNDVVDKSRWPRGEWDHEPDKVQWKDKTTGYPCIIVRGPVGGLCGYVAVPPSHPLYRKHYDGLDISRGVHGGVTFSDRCADDGTKVRTSATSLNPETPTACGGSASTAGTDLTSYPNSRR